MADDTIKSELRKIRVIHAALAAGMISLALIAFLLPEKPDFRENAELHSILLILASVFAISGMMGSRYIFTRMLTGLRGKALPEKLEIYRKANIIRYALLEFPVIFALVSYLINPVHTYLLIAGILFILFLVARPGELKMRTDIGQNR